MFSSLRLERMAGIIYGGVRAVGERRGESGGREESGRRGESGGSGRRGTVVVVVVEEQDAVVACDLRQDERFRTVTAGWLSGIGLYAQGLSSHADWSMSPIVSRRLARGSRRSEASAPLAETPGMVFVDLASMGLYAACMDGGVHWRRYPSENPAIRARLKKEIWQQMHLK